MIRQGNDHKIHHCNIGLSPLAELLLLPRPRRGMGAAEDVMHPVPILWSQPHPTQQVKPGPSRKAGQRKKPRYPGWARCGNDTAEHKPLQCGVSTVFLKKPRSNSQDTRHSEEMNSLQDTFQMSPEKLHTHPNCICQLGATTKCRRATRAALT